MEWVRFWITAALLALSVVSFLSCVVGVFRFGFVMNRVHAAGVGDTLGMASAAAAVMIGTGEAAVILKLILIVVFLWCTSPVSAHFIGQIEYYMNNTFDEHMIREDQHDDI